MNILLSSLQKMLKAVFPNRCEFCGNVIEINESICEECKRLPVIEPPFCIYCGFSKSDCKCKKHKKEYKAVIAPYYYKDSVSRGVLNFKFSEMKFLSKRMGRDIAECVKNYYNMVSFDAVCFVPQHKSKYRVRDYNQSQLLANEIGRIIGVPVMPLLVKTLKNKPQKRQTEKERKVNVFGVYDVADKDFVKGKTILLVDDVKTTGATLNECSKMLNIYNADEVYCAVLAIVGNKN